MAIEIVKRGEPPDKSFKGTCRQCNSEVKATDQDTRNVVHDPREGGEMVEITCPVCGFNMWCYR